MTQPAAPCPICDKALPPAEAGAKDYRPFCSKRCADLDLQRWFSGRYAIPGASGDGRDDQALRDDDG